MNKPRSTAPNYHQRNDSVHKMDWSNERWSNSESFCGTKPLRWCSPPACWRRQRPVCGLCARCAMSSNRVWTRCEARPAPPPASTRASTHRPALPERRKPNGSSRTHPQQTVWPMCQKPTARPVGLRPLLVRGLGLVRCANPPRCKPSPRLPAVRLRLPPRSLSRGAS